MSHTKYSIERDTALKTPIRLRTFWKKLLAFSMNSKSSLSKFLIIKNNIVDLRTLFYRIRKICCFYNSFFMIYLTMNDIFKFHLKKLPLQKLKKAYYARYCNHPKYATAFISRL